MFMPGLNISRHAPLFVGATDTGLLQSRQADTTSANGSVHGGCAAASPPGDACRATAAAVLGSIEVTSTRRAHYAIALYRLGLCARAHRADVNRSGLAARGYEDHLAQRTGRLPRVRGLSKRRVLRAHSQGL